MENLLIKLKTNLEYNNIELCLNDGDSIHLPLYSSIEPLEKDVLDVTKAQRKDSEDEFSTIVIIHGDKRAVACISNKHLTRTA